MLLLKKSRSTIGVPSPLDISMKRFLRRFESNHNKWKSMIVFHLKSIYNADLSSRNFHLYQLKVPKIADSKISNFTENLGSFEFPLFSLFLLSFTPACVNFQCCIIIFLDLLYNSFWRKTLKNVIDFSFVFIWFKSLEKSLHWAFKW